MEDDLLQAEQIKKKKRFVLLLLLVLLAVTAGAAALLETPAPATVAAVKPSPSPGMATSTPSPVEGDEWSHPPPALSPIVTTASDTGASSPDLTATAEGRPEATVTSTPASASAGTPDLEITPTVTTSTQAATWLAETSPAVTPDESEENRAATPVGENEGPVITSKVTPAPTEISKRINESWDVLHGQYGGGDASPTLTPSGVVSETLALAPPDGLPVTGIIPRQGMNWAAVGVLGLLIGAGAAALLYPRPGHGGD